MSNAEFGLEFLRCCAQDDRLSRADLAEIVEFAASTYIDGEVDKATKAKAAHTAAIAPSLIAKRWASV
jgi:hypothetical protein